MITPRDAARLVVSDLWSRRGVETVLRGVDLELHAGEVVLLEGANGSGKTTLLETIAGLIRPLSGAIRLDGQRIDGQRADRVVARGVALVHQERHLFATLTVAQHLALAGFATRRGTPAHSLATSLETFGLEPFEATPAGLLSGGEQRLLAIARGLRARPLVALMDEPLAALAAGLRERILRHLRALADGGTAVMVVEHDAARVRPYADRSLVLRDGVLAGEWIAGGGVHHH